MRLSINPQKIRDKYFADIRRGRITLIRKEFRQVKSVLRHSLKWDVEYELGYEYDKYVAHRFISRYMSPHITTITLFKKKSNRFASGSEELNHIRISYSIKK